VEAISIARHLNAHDSQRIVDTGNETLRRYPFAVATHLDLVEITTWSRCSDVIARPMVSDREVRHLISTGYLSLESSGTAASIAIALEAWIYMKRRKSCQSQARERLLLGTMRAEDAAVAYLHKFDPAVALATACSVEQTLAIKWEAEQEEMRRRGDPRKVMCLTDRQRGELGSAIAKVPKGVYPDTAAEHHLLQILKDLPPDRAWWVSHLVVRYEDHQFQASKSRSTEVHLDQSIDMAIQIPDTIRRAAARMESCGM
jgi:hypothetical protein